MSASGTRFDFGTSGKLWKSDLLMYDRETHSLSSQMEGRAVVGPRAWAEPAGLALLKALVRARP